MLYASCFATNICRFDVVAADFRYDTLPAPPLAAMLMPPLFRHDYAFLLHAD